MVALRESVAFDAPQETPDGSGGRVRTWEPAHACRAQFIYQRGREAEVSGGLTGTAVFKVKVRSCAAARAITTAYRMRDVRRDLAFNIREVDAISSRAWVWIVAEKGVAV